MTDARRGADPEPVRAPGVAPEIQVEAPRRVRRVRRWVSAGALVAAAVVVITLVVPGIVSWWSPPEPSGLLLASGRIEGRITTLTPKSPARVVALHADEGDAVTQGQLLATLDDAAQRERVRSATEQVAALDARIRAADAALAMTERQVALQTERAEAALHEADSRLARAQHNLVQAERDAERAAELVARGLIAPQAAEHARLRAEIEEHGVREAEQAVVSGQKQLALARLGAEQVVSMRAERDALTRQRLQAQAQLAEQQSYVADFAIRSPTPGRVLTRTVERGELVAASTPLFSLVDLDRLYVKIYVPEPSIGKIALGQEARVYVDAYPGRPFAARVSRVSQESEFTPKNVETREERVKLVFAVEVALAENPDGVLKPGMPADAVIRWRAGAAWGTPGTLSPSGFWRHERGDAGR